MKSEALAKILERLRNHNDNILSITWVGNNYSKLDLIHDLENLQQEQFAESYEKAVETIRDYVDNVKCKVAKMVRETFPAFSSQVSVSVDDQNILIVKLFNVPVEQFHEIYEKLYAIEHELFKKGEFVIVPDILY